MEKINLTKYGFVRSPEDDFSDDGNRFTSYKVGKVRLSKLVKWGDAYISARLDGQLPYEVYSKLPHYSYLNDLNGVTTSQVTENSLQELYEACISYEKEYDDALANYKFPTFEELDNKRKELNKIYGDQFDELLNDFITNSQLLLKMSDCDLRDFREALQFIKSKKIDDNVIKSYVKTAYSTSYIKQDIDTYWYNRAKNILAKY